MLDADAGFRPLACGGLCLLDWEGANGEQSTVRSSRMMDAPKPGGRERGGVSSGLLAFGAKCLEVSASSLAVADWIMKPHAAGRRSIVS